MTLRWDCEKQGCYKKALPDWGMLQGCFTPTRVAPADVDGQVEQNRKFLILEQKSPGVGLSDPALRGRKLSVDRGDTHVTFWSRGSEVQEMHVVGLEGYDVGRVECSLQDLRQACYDWWRSVYQCGNNSLPPTCPPLRIDGHHTKVPAQLSLHVVSATARP
jgi:hypothetical protein